MSWKTIRPSVENPLWVTGLPGVPGWNLFHGLKRIFPGGVRGQRPVANYKAHAEGVWPLDSEDREGLERIFAQWRFAAVIDASGNCALRACECDPVLSRALNYDFGVRIARLSARHGIPLMRLSTDLVFSGIPGTGGYREDTPVDPVTVYGRDMADAETEILSIYPEAVILRVPLPIGLSPGGHAGAIDWIEWRFRKGRPATLYFDEWRSVISMHDVTRVIAYWLANPSAFSPGIYHCGGLRDLSLYQIGQIINAVGAYPPELLKGCMRIEAGPLPPRAGHVGVNSDKILDILPQGMLRPWPIHDFLVPDGSLDWHFKVDRSRWKNRNAIGALLLDEVYFCSEI